MKPRSCGRHRAASNSASSLSAGSVWVPRTCMGAAGGATEHVQHIALGALGAFEPATTQPAVFFQMSDHWFHCWTSFDPAPLSSRQGLGLASMQHLHAIDLAPAIAQVHDRYRRFYVQILQQSIRLLQLLGQGIPVVRGARKTARAHDQALAGAHRTTDLDAECVRLTRFALADAFHFRRMQRSENWSFLARLCGL